VALTNKNPVNPRFNSESSDRYDSQGGLQLTKMILAIALHRLPDKDYIRPSDSKNGLRFAR
jgi:hypothetical protein